jgi:hypothetical protein
MKYTYLIDDDTLQGLKCLIDKQVDALFGDGFAVHENHIETRAFEIKVSNNLWLNLSCEAKETPKDSDYYKFIIKSNNAPLEIPFNKESNSLVYPFSKVIVKQAVVKTIEIYNRNEIYGQEEFNYDVLILFNCEKKIRFMIALAERVDEAVIYSSSSLIINKYLNGLNCRIKLC